MSNNNKRKANMDISFESENKMMKFDLRKFENIIPFPADSYVYPNEYRLFKEEYNAKMSWFNDYISSFAEFRLTRDTFSSLKTAWCIVVSNMLFFTERLNTLFNEGHISTGDYYSCSANVVLEVLRATRTPMGQMVIEHHPKLKEIVDQKFVTFSTPSNNTRMENHPKIKELREFAKNYYNRVVV